MKGKRFSTEEKIRMLREADTGKSIVELCRDKNNSEPTFHRWKREFGMTDINEARWLQELEKENTALKKMQADEILENRVLAVRERQKLRARGTRSRWPPRLTACAPGGLRPSAAGQFRPEN
jgi:putative transposase